MTDRQKDYIVGLIKKVFRNEKSQSEMLSRLDRADVTNSQASLVIHALRLEYNIYRSLPSSMWGARNLNPKMDEFYKILGFEQ